MSQVLEVGVAPYLLFLFINTPYKSPYSGRNTPLKSPKSDMFIVSFTYHVKIDTLSHYNKPSYA